MPSCPTPAKALVALTVLLLLTFDLANAEPRRFFGSASGEAYLPVEQAFPFSESLDENGLVLTWGVAPGYYLYQDRIEVTAPGADVEIGALEFARKGELKEDPYFGATPVFYDAIEVRVPVTLTGPSTEAQLFVTFQGCAEAGLCYPPETRELLYVSGTGEGGEPAGGNEAAGATASWRSLDSAADLATFLTAANPVWVALAFFVLGLGLTFTPCVLPMIPIVSAIVAGARQISTLQAFGLSLAYVLGMAITYAAAGVITGLLGASFNVQMYLQSPWALGTVAFLFIVFALAMFGLYDLQLPAAIRDRLSQKSARLSGGRLASVFGIGAFSALIVSPCVSAPLAGALVYIGTTQDALLGGLALLMLGLGMGVPLLIVGTGGRRFIPRTGPWLATVKGGFGILMLAIALWLLERLIPPAVTVGLWGALAIFTGTQLGAFEAAPGGLERTRRALGLILFATGLLMLIGALAGARDPLQPLSPFQTSSARAGSAIDAVTHAGFDRFADPAELETRLAAADGQPVMFDFYADWCISCKIMERNVFSDPDIAEQLSDFALLQIDLTENSADQRALLDRFGLFGPPAILFFDAKGQEIKSLRVLGEMDREAFSAHLKKVGQTPGFENIGR
ncbi:MAG: thiol:disulfide interchange protein [Alteromonadaceae bacterium]|uniref:Thiol:disulfide interchange protein DsbD n=2 Tax=Hydrocarboniclastica marina TaxID=2259620 RepID=A0A4P7XHD8_9ALTE|nr:thiol:disulfide interchange protein [Alteromonadaceae bacterium]QCF25642.1 protein-disulfide reductase DsbD [Hydrocarboniclastica marina]